MGSCTLAKEIASALTSRTKRIPTSNTFTTNTEVITAVLNDDAGSKTGAAFYLSPALAQLTIDFSSANNFVALSLS